MSEVLEGGDLYDWKIDSEKFVKNSNKIYGNSPIEFLLPNLNDNKDKSPIISRITPFPRYPGTHDRPHMMFNYTVHERPVKFLKNNIIVYSSGISSLRNCKLFKFFKDKVQSLFETGIIPHKLETTKLSNYYKSCKNLFRVFECPPKFVPLNLKMLEAGFVIWMITVAIVILVFFGEVVIFYFPKLVQTIKMKKLKLPKMIKKQKFQISMKISRKLKFKSMKLLKMETKTQLGLIDLQ